MIAFQLRTLVLATTPIFALGSSLWAQQALVSAPTGAAQGYSIEAGRVDSGPGPEGWRNNPLWAQATAATDFVQLEPSEGAPATERTEVRVLFDSEAIYVGAWMYDSDASRIIVGERRRDANLTQSDGFRLVLDTYRDEQNGFVFGTNPGGIEFDGQIIAEGRGGAGVGRQQQGTQSGFNVNWDGAWTVHTERDDQGWYAFFRIPFSTLRFRSGTDQRWGVNFGRFIGRKNEEVVWSPIPRQFNLYRLSNAGVLSGVAVPAGRPITFTPYALGSAQRIPAVSENVSYPFEFGGDVKVGLTPGITLDLTMNTDFAQVEVDEQQIDLTRFSLFFPEKRPFFLENAGRFAVGSNRSAQVFFSRRIGIARSGAPVPIEWGSRLSGRAGGMDIGMLHMRTEELQGVQAQTDWSVARISRELPNRSSIGAIVTNRSAVNLSDDYGRTFAVDGSIGVGEFFNIGAMASTVDRPGVTSGREAILVTSDYRSRQWQVTGFYDRVGGNYIPEVGYLRRGNFQQFGGAIWRFVRPSGISWLREIQPHANYDVGYRLDGGKETQVIHFHVPIRFQNGGSFSNNLDNVFDGLFRPYTPPGGPTVPAGDYRGWTYNSSVNTNPQAPYSLRGSFDYGYFLSGTRTAASATFNMRQGGTLAGSFGVEHNMVDLKEGSFDATLLRGRLAYSFTPNVFVQSLVQYGSQTKVLSGNVRLGWLTTAGTGLYVVYNERQMDQFDVWNSLERSLVVKYTRQFDVSHLGRDLFGR